MCFDGRKIEVKVENLESAEVRAWKVEATTVKSDGLTEETGLPIRGLMG